MHAILNGLGAMPSNTAPSYAYVSNTISHGWQGQENAGNPFGDSCNALSDAITITKISFYVSAAPGGSATWQFTVRKNLADTAATVTIGSASTSATWTGSVSFSQLDLISIKANPPSGAPANTNVFWTIEYDSVGSDYYLVMGAALSNQNFDLYATPFGAKTPYSATATDFEVVVPTDLTVTKIAGTLTAGPGAGTSYIFTVRKNNTTDLGVSATVANSATTAVSAAGSLSFTAGDTMVLKRTSSGGPGWLDCAYCITIVPTNSGEVINAFGNLQQTDGFFTGYECPPGVGTNVQWAGTETNAAGRLSGCTLQKLYVKLVTAPAGTASRLFTLRSNAADTAVAATVTGVATTANDTSHTATHIDGNMFSVSTFPSGSVINTLGIKVSFVQVVPQPTNPSLFFSMF